MIASFAEVGKLVKEVTVDPAILACVEPHEPSLLSALSRAVAEDLIKPVLIGEERKIQQAAAQAQVQINGWELVRSPDPDNSVYTALDLVKNGKVKGLVKGIFGIKDFLSLCFRSDLGFRVGRKKISGVMACKVEQLNRMLFIADPLVAPHPGLIELIAILQNTVHFAHGLGYEIPKVALLAAVEVIYPQMPATLAEAAISKMADKGQIKGCLVDGPLSMDVAIIASAARDKGARGEVAGHADVLIGHNLAVSYGVYKAFAMYTRSDYGMVALGGRVPAVVCSRNDSTAAKYNSLLLALAANDR
jgi:phosphate butyryltransferase